MNFYVDIKENLWYYVFNNGNVLHGGIMKIRINKTGLGDPNIQRLGDDRVAVEMAGVTDLQRIKDLIKSTGSMEFLLLLISLMTLFG